MRGFKRLRNLRDRSLRTFLISCIVMTRLRQCVLSLVTLFAVAGPSVSAQIVTEWSAETRVALSFHVNDAALQKMLPPGWTSAPSTGAGNKGVNLTVNFIDRQVALDGEGKTYRTGTSRYIVLAVPARNAAGDANTVIVGGLSPEGLGAYGVNLKTVVSRVDRASSAQGEEGGRGEEHWEFAAKSGERIELQIAFRRSPAVKTHAETKLRSALHHDFTRSYRIDQAADVVRSLSTPDRVERLTFRASGAGFAPLFDGQEREVSVP